MRGDLLVPMIKAWGTDTGIDVASIGLQVHGGMGFVEETGAAQHYRDARIAPIYEGTNGIQAADLVTRKLGLENGDVYARLMADIARDAADEPALFALAGECAAIAGWMRDEASLDDRLAGSVPFCTMSAVAVAGWQMLLQMRAVAGGRRAVFGHGQTRDHPLLHRPCRSGSRGPESGGDRRGRSVLHAYDGTADRLSTNDSGHSRGKSS